MELVLALTDFSCLPVSNKARQILHVSFFLKNAVGEGMLFAKLMQQLRVVAAKILRSCTEVIFVIGEEYFF